MRYHLPYAHRYHTWWNDQLIRLIRQHTLTGTILDNGCGTGRLIEQIGAEYSLIGLDLSLNMLRYAQRRAPHMVQGDSLFLPFPDATFDVVVARSLLHHLPNPEDGVAEIKRVLKRGGHMVVADTNRSFLNLIPRAIAYRGDSFSSAHRNFHRHEYLAWLSRYFTVEHVQFFGYLAYPFGFPDMMGPFRKIPFPSYGGYSSRRATCPNSGLEDNKLGTNCCRSETLILALPENK